MFQKFTPLVSSIKWHLNGILEHRFLIIMIVCLNVANGMFTTEQLRNIATSSIPAIQDTLFVSFAGPAIGNTNLITVLVWLLNQVFFLLLSASLLSEHSTTDNYLILLRLPSRSTWLIGIVISILFAAIFYVSLVVICCVSGIAIVQGWNTNNSSFFNSMGLWTQVSKLSFAQVVTLVWVSLYSSVITESLLLTYINLRIRRIIWSIMFLIFQSLLSWVLGASENIYLIQIWLPATQSIISRHIPFESKLPTFTFLFSLMYTFLFCSLFTYGAFSSIKNVDFLGDHNDNI